MNQKKRSICWKWAASNSTEISFCLYEQANHMLDKSFTIKDKTGCLVASGACTWNQLVDGLDAEVGCGIEEVSSDGVPTLMDRHV